jgi:peptidoglycan/xylan/chitin deacetylase (PgdA/CDA1 family)
MLRVLTYHRVANLQDSPALNPQIISATPENFVKQMRFLAKAYNVVAMPQVLAAIVKKERLPQRAVLITFDDAYYDFGEIAWPILKSLNLPATLFVPTAYPDQPARAFWWDRLHRAFVNTPRRELRATPIGILPLADSQGRRQSLRRLQSYIKNIPHRQAIAVVDEICAKLDPEPLVQKSVLSWNELRQLAKEGVTLCAHTQTHPIMTQLSPEEARQEIVGSQNDLQGEIGEALPIFCYPGGGHDDTVVDILKEEGFTLAFTTLKGQNDLRTADPLRLRRTNMTRRTSLPIFRFRLLRVGASFDRWRQKRRRTLQQPGGMR